MTPTHPDFEPGFEPEDQPLPPPPLSEEDAQAINAQTQSELDAERAAALADPRPPEVIALEEALTIASLEQALLQDELSQARSAVAEHMAKNTMLARRVHDLETQRAGLAQLLNALAPMPDPDRER